VRLRLTDEAIGGPATPRLVRMFNVGGGELLVIMLVALIVLGPQRLPGAARQVGKVMGDIRRVSSGFQQELKDAFDAESDDTPARRAEPVPLARAVADADADDRDRSSAPASRSLREVPAGDTAAAPPAGAAGVAPDVARALDEIVPPSVADDDATPRPQGSPGRGPEAVADDEHGEPGDERAAS
jgi:sec-independent protein translocase protein TatB